MHAQNSSNSKNAGLNTLKKLGVGSWSLLGFALVIMVFGAAFNFLSTVTVPLMIAFILGSLLEPVMVFLEKKKMGKSAAATVTILLTLLLTAVLTWFVIAGFVQQIPEMFKQLTRGWNSLLAWANTIDFDPEMLENLRKTVLGAIPVISKGTVGVIVGTLSNTITVAMGLFFALFFLFFLLRDRTQFSEWTARISRVNVDTVLLVNTQVNQSFRGYFKGTALTALITAPIFMIPILLLKVPLALPIFILYFVLSFIPYLGAVMTGVFATLIAFSSGGLPVALIILASLLVSNSVIQNVVMSWLLGSSLKMHPVMVLLTTIVGGIIAGLLGMVLGPPLVAAVTSSISALKQQKETTT